MIAFGAPAAAGAGVPGEAGAGAAGVGSGIGSGSAAAGNPKPTEPAQHTAACGRRRSARQVGGAEPPVGHSRGRSVSATDITSPTATATHGPVEPIRA